MANTEYAPPRFRVADVLRALSRRLLKVEVAAPLA